MTQEFDERQMERNAFDGEMIMDGCLAEATARP